MEEAITVFDWQRMLVGDEPPWFLFEILFRTTVVYVYALALLRWLGSRTIGQLSTIEFLLVIALGSAIGDPMFYPDVPLIHALAVVTVVVFANKGLDMLIARFKRAERIIDGVPEEIIRDGVFCKEFFASTSMGSSEVFQLLRERSIEQMGQVARAYVESDGGLAVFLAREPRPGLPISPPWEIEKPEMFHAPVTPNADTILACARCGETHALKAGASLAACTHCGHDRFAAAREEPLFASPEQG